MICIVVTGVQVVGDYDDIECRCGGCNRTSILGM